MMGYVISPIGKRKKPMESAAGVIGLEMRKERGNTT